MAHSQVDDMEVEEPSSDLLERQTVDNAEALQVRREYRRLISEVQDKREDLLKEDCEDLLDHVRTANTLYERVRRPQEAVLDARFMSLSMSIADEKAKNLQTNLVEFKPEEFMAKLLTKMEGRYIGDSNDETEISPESWRSFGRDVTKFFAGVTPAVAVMSGTFAKPPKPDRPTPTPEKDPTQRNDRASASAKPQTVTQVANDGKEATVEEIERVYAIIKKLLEDDPTPLDFFELVVNPDSYGYTIENIFHLSFLVKDGLIRITCDESSGYCPAVTLVDQDNEQEDNPAEDGRSKRSNQAMISLSMEDWRDLIQVYELEGRIPFIEPIARPTPTEEQIVESTTAEQGDGE